MSIEAAIKDVLNAARVMGAEDPELLVAYCPHDPVCSPPHSWGVWVIDEVEIEDGDWEYQVYGLGEGHSLEQAVANVTIDIMDGAVQDAVQTPPSGRTIN